MLIQQHASCRKLEIRANMNLFSQALILSEYRHTFTTDFMVRIFPEEFQSLHPRMENAWNNINDDDVESMFQAYHELERFRDTSNVYLDEEGLIPLLGWVESQYLIDVGESSVDETDEKEYSRGESSVLEESLEDLFTNIINGIEGRKYLSENINGAGDLPSWKSIDPDLEPLDLHPPQNEAKHPPT